MRRERKEIAINGRGGDHKPEGDDLAVQHFNLGLMHRSQVFLTRDRHVMSVPSVTTGGDQTHLCNEISVFSEY